MLRVRPTAAALGGLALAAALTGLAAPATAAPSAAAPAADELVKLMVALDGDLTPALADALQAAGVVRGVELSTIDAVAVTAPADAVPLLRALPGVRAVEPQRRIELQLYRSKEQIDAVGVDAAETYDRGGQQVERPGVTGEGVRVGIIDSGIFAEHPGFEDRVVAGLNFELSEIPDSGVVGSEEWDGYVEGTGDFALVDELGHGTHVAGTVAGSGAGAASHDDLAGVAPAAELVSLKIASGANGFVDDIDFEENAVAAIDYLVRHPELGVTLTNNSWGLLPTEPSTVPGEPTDFDAAAEVTRAAVAAGITMVFSAGNDGPDAGTIGPDPGGLPEVITVAAACKGDEEGQGGSCPAGEITEFSSRGAADGSGPQVDVAAPGDQILAPVSPSALAGLNECPDAAEPLYFCISGTSMASPHVAGVVALMQQANPELTPAQAEECLTTTAADLLEPGFDIASGEGMVDTRAALVCAHSLVPVSTTGPATATPVAQPVQETRTLAATGGPALLALTALLSLGGAAALRRTRG